MKLKETIRLVLIGTTVFVLAWFASGTAIAAAVLLVSTHAVNLSEATFLPAMVPVMSICLAAVVAAGVVLKCRKKKDKTGQHPAAPYSEPAARSPQG